MENNAKSFWDRVRAEQGDAVNAFWKMTSKERHQDSLLRLEKMKQYFSEYFDKKSMALSIKAMHIAIECHTGFRKNGEVNVIHQFEVAGIAIQLFGDSLSDEMLDVLVAACFLHDVLEDHSDKYDEQRLTDVGFSEQVLTLVKLVTKGEGFSKTKDEYEAYYFAILGNVFAIFLKAMDRLHNLRSMTAGFSETRQIDYINETILYILPLLKEARRMDSSMYMKSLTLSQQIRSVINTASFKLKHLVVDKN